MIELIIMDLTWLVMTSHKHALCNYMLQIKTVFPVRRNGSQSHRQCLVKAFGACCVKIIYVNVFTQDKRL